jgi:D-glycero-beta-D-manno-heptose 1-phosphate adenylyltransferase
MHNFDVIQSKILEYTELGKWLAYVRFKKQRIVFTNGCFDVLHRGHIEYLAKAADLGDILVVGLNSDASVRKLKGPARPFLDEKARGLILAALHFVSYVILFNEETPYQLIQKIQPDILVKGGDYKKVEEIVGYDIVKEHGGEVLTIPLTEGYSSTGIIEKLTGKS